MKLDKIVVDTNVCVSACIHSESVPSLVLKHVFIHSQLCLSEEVFAEYKDVLAQPKFSNRPQFATLAQKLLTLIRLLAQWYVPIFPLHIIGDEQDNRFLELAQESDVDFLITGNVNDFSFDRFLNTMIASPR